MKMKHKDTLSKTHSTSRKWEKSMKKRTKKSQRQLDKDLVDRSKIRIIQERWDLVEGYLSKNKRVQND